MLLWFVIAYLVVSIALGLVAATRVHSAKDYITAGRHLPIYVVFATVFATWFGAETVLGISATFLREGMSGLVSDPFGASLCLVLVGLFWNGAGAVTLALLGEVKWSWLPALLAGSLVGGYLGAHWAIVKGNLWIKRAFEIVTMLVGLKLLF